MNNFRIKGRGIRQRVARFFKYLYLKLFRINDSPERVAFGLGIGVFFGVMPGMGPLVALFAAVILKANRAAAFVGGILTNTWLSIPVFLAAAKAGAFLTGSSYSYLHEQWHLFLSEFRWAALFKVSVYKLLFPVLVGYIVVSFIIGVIVYTVSLLILKTRKKIKGKKGMALLKTLIFAAAVFTISGPCYCEDGARETRMARGIVTSRDFVSSTLVVNYVRYHVPPDVRVYKGNSKMGFSAININDPVTLRYYQDSSGAYQATDITVEYSGDFPV